LKVQLKKPQLSPITIIFVLAGLHWEKELLINKINEKIQQKDFIAM
jgi:hypothetical protein